MSNLLQKASIVTTPTAYGVGVLNSIKPAYALGDNLLTQNWTTAGDWTFTNNGTTNATLNKSTSSTTDCRQSSIGAVQDRKYRLEFVISVYTSGSLTVKFGGGTTISIDNEAVGRFSVDIDNDGNLDNFQFGNSFQGTIEQIRLREITDADFDFTRTSSATRVNPDYLLETVSINGSELIQNGNFSELGSELVTNGDFETDSDWNLRSVWVISNGVCSLTPPNSDYLSQSNVFTANKFYKLSFDIVVNSGSLEPQFFDSGFQTIGTYSTTQSVVVYFESTSSGTLYFKPNSFDGSIDNVSVKQVDPNDYWTVINGSITDIYNASMTAYQSGIRITPFSYTGTFKVVFDLVVTSGSCKFDAGSGNDEIYTTSGTKEKIITNPTKFEFNAFNLGWVGTLDNVSVIELQQNGVPRLDYTNGTASILLEPQSTNNLSDSNDSFSVNNTSVTYNNANSPEGTLNAFKVQSTSSGTSNYLRSASIVFTDPVTFSVFVKYGNVQYLQLLTSKSNTHFLNFDVENGIIGTKGSNTEGEFVQYPNGWYRVSATFSGFSGSNNFRLYISNSNSASYAGGTATTGDFFYSYGWQIENGSYATSYIPTSGSSVTRAAETLNNAANSDLINSTEGVLYVEIAALADDGTYRILSLSDGTTDERIYIQYTNVSNTIAAVVKNGGVTQANRSFVLSDETQFNKIAFKYKANDFALWINGVQVGTDTNGSVPVGLSKLALDQGNGSVDFYGKVKTIAVFKEALSDTELACLTSTNNREIFLNYYYRMQYVGANTEALSCAEQTFNI